MKLNAIPHSKRTQHDLPAFSSVKLLHCGEFYTTEGQNRSPENPETRERKSTSVTSAEALIQIVCKNDKARLCFSQTFFVFYKFFIIRKLTNTFCNDF